MFKPKGEKGVLGPEMDKGQNRENQVKAEIGTTMLATFSRTSQPFKAIYVGMEPGSYLILRFPPGTGIHDHLFEGNALVVKYVHGGKVYGFRTEVMAYLYKKRIILVVLAYPEIVETVALRKEQRIDFLVPARLTVAGEGLDGFIVDLSPSGCRFAMDVTPEHIPYDFKIIKEATIAFQLIGQEGMKELPG